MTLLEWYFDNGVDGTGSPAIAVTILPVTQWKYRMVSGLAKATGSSTNTTTTLLRNVNSVDTADYAQLIATTSSTDTSAYAQQYGGFPGNTGFNPLVGNVMEEIIAYIQNAAGISDNYVSLALEIDLDGDFDE